MQIPIKGMITEKITVGMPQIDARAGEISAASIIYFLSPLMCCITVSICQQVKIQLMNEHSFINKQNNVRQEQNGRLGLAIIKKIK